MDGLRNFSTATRALKSVGKEHLSIRITRALFVLVIGTMVITGKWVLDRYYDLQLWMAYFKLKH